MADSSGSTKITVSSVSVVDAPRCDACRGEMVASTDTEWECVFDCPLKGQRVHTGVYPVRGSPPAGSLAAVMVGYIRTYLDVYGNTQGTLAAASGLAQSTVSKIARGISPGPSRDDIRALAAVVGTPLSEVGLGDEDDGGLYVVRYRDHYLTRDGLTTNILLATVFSSLAEAAADDAGPHVCWVGSVRTSTKCDAWVMVCQGSLDPGLTTVRPVRVWSSLGDAVTNLTSMAAEDREFDWDLVHVRLAAGWGASTWSWVKRLGITRMLDGTEVEVLSVVMSGDVDGNVRLGCSTP